MEKGMKIKSSIMDGTAMHRAIRRLAHEIIENNEGIDNVYLIGIRTRGLPIARHIADYIEEFEGKRVSLGVLDITLYRDDLSIISDHPIINSTEIPFNITGTVIVLVDDVVYTGRTVRAAIEALMELGRPARIQLAALIARGHRELPIRADYVGKNVPTAKNEIVSVSLAETDGEDGVYIMEREGL